MTENEVIEVQAEIGQKYSDDPVFFAEHGLGLWTWSKMREILYSVRDNPKTIIYACHGSSKTFTAAIAGVWFFETNLDEEIETKVVTTAPVFFQVKKLLWTKISEIYRKSRIKLTGECLQTEIKNDENPDSYMVGFATKEQVRAEGSHAWNALYIFDEAKGIPGWMWDSAMAQMGGGNCRILVVSTTDGVQPGSEFHNAAKSDNEAYADWNRIYIDCKDLPTFTGEKMRRFKWNDKHGFSFDYEEKSVEDLRIQLSTPQWEKERMLEWGEDSVLYYTKCRGHIVDELPDQAIPLWKVMKMFKNYQDPDFDDTGVIENGGDIARMGDDSTAIWQRKGMKIQLGGPLVLNKKRNYEVVDQMENKGFLPNKDIVSKIDDTGEGGGTTDELFRRKYNETKPVRFNQDPKDKDHYKSAIDEMWFELEKKIDKIACPYNAELLKQLTSRKKLPPNDKGQRMIESKKDYKNRMKGKSPDLADGFLLCFYTPYEGNICEVGFV